MAQTAAYLIANQPAIQGIPFSQLQLTAITAATAMDPNAYPIWVIQQAEYQRAGLPINGPTNVAATSLPANNSGSLVRQDQLGRQENANPLLPVGGSLIQTQPNGRVIPPTSAVPTNARRPVAVVDSGTNAPVRPITSTQATPPPTAQPIQGSNNPDAFVASRTAGVGAAGQDSVTRAGTVQGLQNVFLGSRSKITPQPNSLAKYGSYTYNLSLYIMSPKDYQKTVAGARISIPGSQLLIQSGGMPGTSSTPTPSDSTNQGVTGQTPGLQTTAAGRNQYFPLDFYIDDFTITNLQPGKGTGSANAVTNMKFKIIEPNGISLLDNLYSACEQYVGKKQNYAAQTYLMVIRFYGYDENGNLVRPDNGTIDIRTDSNALVEKYIPFQFTKIGFRVANQLTEYNCEAVVPGNNQASGQARGIIPYNTELQAETIAGLFGGQATYNEQQQADGRAQIATESAQDGPGVPAPPKANAAPKKVITGGLVDALNQYERERVSEGIFTVADEYEIIFPDPVIADAKTKPPGIVDKAKVGQPTPSTAGQQLNPATNSMNPNTQTKPSVAGMSIIQFIDQAVKTSSYIYEQQTVQYDQDGNEIPNGNVPQLFAWYRIGVQALPIQYDPKRNDYAYKITYSVAPYRVNDVKSEYFNKSSFVGTHKKYYYWFTGENVEILDYQQDFNNLYYVVVNGNQPPKNGPILDYRDIPKKAYQTRSQESDQGQDGKINEPAANAATSLYSPADLSRVKISIVGDPAWIAQGEVWRNIRSFTYSPFHPDGTINYEIQEPLFEIGWNKPVDYSLTTGLMEPNQRTNGANEIDSLAPGPTQSYIYRAVSVTSSFRQGKFTQDLEGVLVQFPSTAIKKNDAPSEYEEFSTLTPSPNSNAANGRNAAPATTTAPGVRPPSNTSPVIQPRRGAAAPTANPNTRTTVGSRREAPGTANTDRFGRPAVQPLTTRAPTSGNQAVGSATAPTNTNVTASPPVNTAPQRGAKDY
jgi:hypothetical protein